MQKDSKYIIELLKVSIIVGLGISLTVLITQAIFGRTFQWNIALAGELLYNVYFGFVLTVINKLLFDYLNQNIKWEKNKEYYGVIIGFVSSIPLTMLGTWFIRFTTEVVMKNRSFVSFIENDQLDNYTGPLIITFIVSLIFHVVFLYGKVQQNKVKEHKIIAGNASAQFESLKNQIDPHFLFNSLNVLSSLIEENPENAQRFTTSLSKIYRYVLEQKDKELVPLQEELDFAKTYMKLLTMRFENSLTYSLPDVTIPDGAKVVPLALQLLLENAIKHNVVSDVQPLHISIYFEHDYLIIANNLQKKEVLQSGTGVGLRNIVSRYSILTKKEVKVTSDELEFKVAIPILTREGSLLKSGNYDEAQAYLEAKRKVQKIKEFYGSLLSYSIVIPLLIFVNYVSFWKFKWFVFPMLGWGLGLAIQAFTVFGYGKTWEDRKINEYIEKDQKSKNQKWT